MTFEVILTISAIMKMIQIMLVKNVLLDMSFINHHFSFLSIQIWKTVLSIHSKNPFDNEGVAVEEPHQVYVEPPDDRAAKEQNGLVP